MQEKSSLFYGGWREPIRQKQQRQFFMHHYYSCCFIKCVGFRYLNSLDKSWKDLWIVYFINRNTRKTWFEFFSEKYQLHSCKIQSNSNNVITNRSFLNLLDFSQLRFPHSLIIGDSKYISNWIFTEKELCILCHLRKGLFAKH